MEWPDRNLDSQSLATTPLKSEGLSPLCQARLATLPPTRGQLPACHNASPDASSLATTPLKSEGNLDGHSTQTTTTVVDVEVIGVASPFAPPSSFSRGQLTNVKRAIRLMLPDRKLNVLPSRS